MCEMVYQIHTTTSGNNFFIQKKAQVTSMGAFIMVGPDGKNMSFFLQVMKDLHLPLKVTQLSVRKKL